MRESSPRVACGTVPTCSEIGQGGETNPGPKCKLAEHIPGVPAREEHLSGAVVEFLRPSTMTLTPAALAACAAASAASPGPRCGLQVPGHSSSLVRWHTHAQKSTQALGMVAHKVENEQNP